MLLSAVAVALIIIAATAQGFPVRHVSANDGGVWLTNNSLGAYGRFNDPTGQLDTAFGPPGAFQSSYDLDVLQQGTTVLAVDRSRSAIYPVDPQHGTVSTRGATLPGSGDAQVALGGTVASVLDGATGRLWSADVGSGTHASLDSLVTTAKPQLTVRGATALAVGTDGTTYVASPTELITLPLTHGAPGRPRVTRLSHRLGSHLSLTAVGSTPVILDADHRAVVLPSSGRTVPVPADDTSVDLVLQQPGPADSSAVLSSDAAAYAMPLGGGSATVLVRGGHGSPAAPVRLGDCVHAAWAGGPGQYGRACQGQPTYETSLPGPALQKPVFRLNNSEIVLNDVANGDAWLVKNPKVQALNSGDWQNLLDSTRPNIDPHSPQTGHTLSLPKDQPPKAVDDQLEARVGHNTVLHVLDNDSDPSGSVLTVVGLSPAQGPGYQAQIAPDGQTISAELDPGQSTPIHFQYTITNTGGQTATATVTVSPTSAETPPALRSGYTPPTYHQSSTATASYQVLGDWRDAEGDPLAVTQASVTQGTVTWTGDGLITYTAPAVGEDTAVSLNYEVSDGLGGTRAGQLPLIVLGTGDTTMYPATTRPDAYQVVVGKAATVNPLQNDVGGADPLHPLAQLALAGPLGAPTGLAISSDTTTGDVSITAQQPGVYAVSYQAGFGSAPAATGAILVDARAAATGPQPPVTVPTSVLLHGQLPSTVNVAAADYDPDGGVLSVVGVSAPSNVQAAVVGGAYVRLTAAGASISGQQIVDYQITNGTTQPVTGQISVTWAPPLPPTPPVAPPVSAVVRAGDEVDVPVLSKDSDPAGQPMHLLPGKAEVEAADAGVASVSGGVLRYAAPDASAVPSTRQVKADYVVEDAAGERTTGVVNLTVNPVDPATDHAPEPKTVVARVTAGGTVIVPIPSSGVDPDGDSVAISGIADPPQLGRILAIGQTSITYQAYPSSGGTDDLTYEVTDPYGQTGQASLRIGVDAVGQVRSPVAVSDDVTAAPGASVVVPILANDLIPANDKVDISPLAATNTHVPAGTKLVGDDLEVRAPTGAAPLVVTYGITDGTGPVSKAQVTVRSEVGYVVPPVAVDDYPKAPTANQASVRVHVLANDSDPTGSPDDLKVVAVFSSAAHISGSDVVVAVHPDPQVVAYEIRNPGGGTAIGTIHLAGAAPGPVLKANSGTISVPRNGSTGVDINKYVSDSHGPVHLLSAADIFTAPASGLAWHPKSDTALTLSGIANYVGPGALTVEVSDARSASDKQARTALISIPVQVGPDVPVISCPTTPLTVIEGGSPLNLRLASVCQVYTSNPALASTLSFSASWGSHPGGVTYSLGGDRHQVLSLSASSSAPAGSSGSIMVTVPKAPAPARLPITVVAAPPPTVNAITVPGVQTGHTATVDLKQYVNSPFAKPSVSVTAVSQTGAGTARVTHGQSTVSITPQTGTHGIMTFSVSVTDIQNRPDRAVQGAITVQVLDVPGNPGPLQGVTANHQVTLSWPASAANGAPVAYYTVSMGGSSRRAPGTSYTWTGLTNGQNYNFSVTAHNQVGDSQGASTGTFAPQAVPDAPGAVKAVPGDGSVQLSWGAANSNGPTIDQYLVTVSPASGGSTQTVDGRSTSYTWTGLNNNVGPYTFSVVAHNKLGIGPSTSSTAVYAHGVPPAPNAPTAALKAGPDDNSTVDTVTFPVISQCNDAQPCKSYSVTQVRNGSPTSDSAPLSCDGSSCTAVYSVTTDGGQYSYEMTATNEEGQTSPLSAASAALSSTGNPAAINDLHVSGGYETVTATFTVPQPHGAKVDHINYTFTDSSTGSTQMGQWTDQTNTGQKATETFNKLAPNDSYTVSAQACNEATKCGTMEQALNSATTSGPQTPGTPTASESGSASPYTVTFSSPDGSSGNQGHTLYLCAQNQPCVPVTPGQQVQYQYGCQQGGAYSVNATSHITDNNGYSSGNATSNSVSIPACPPPKTVQIAWNKGSSGDTRMTVTGFSKGSHTFTCHFGDPHNYTSSPGPYNLPVTSSPQTFTADTCYDTEPGDTMYVDVDGVVSNILQVGG